MAGQGLKGKGGKASGATSEERRFIRLGERDIPVLLRRSARRTFALQIDERGVRVSVPQRARETDIERFVAGNGQWLLDKLAARRERRAAQLFEPVDGAGFSILGEHCRLRFEAGGRGGRWRVGRDGVEELVLDPGHEPRAAMIRALRKRALPWFSARVAEYCFRSGCSMPPVRLSSARTRWGSCSAGSGIRLHWRLIHLPPALIDYVVAHEVAHLTEMNHSARFWAVVGTLYPDWSAARQALREAAFGLPIIEATKGEEFRNED